MINDEYMQRVDNYWRRHVMKLIKADLRDFAAFSRTNEPRLSGEYQELLLEALNAGPEMGAALIAAVEIAASVVEDLSRQRGETSLETWKWLGRDGGGRPPLS